MALTGTSIDTISLILDEQIRAAKVLSTLLKEGNHVYGYAAQTLICCAYDAIGRALTRSDDVGKCIASSLNGKLGANAAKDFTGAVRGKLVHNASIGSDVRIEIGCDGEEPFEEKDGTVILCRLLPQISLLENLKSEIEADLLAKYADNVEYNLISHRSNRLVHRIDPSDMPPAASGRSFKSK